MVSCGLPNGFTSFIAISESLMTWLGVVKSGFGNVVPCFNKSILSPWSVLG